VQNIERDEFSPARDHLGHRRQVPAAPVDREVIRRQHDLVSLREPLDRFGDPRPPVDDGSERVEENGPHPTAGRG